jgi:hypothetical protein
MEVCAVVIFVVGRCDASSLVRATRLCRPFDFLVLFGLVKRLSGNVSISVVTESYRCGVFPHSFPSLHWISCVQSRLGCTVDHVIHFFCMVPCIRVYILGLCVYYI